MALQLDTEGMNVVAAFDARRIVDQLLRAAEPCRVIGFIADGSTIDDPSEFGHYAYLVLKAAGGKQLADMGKRHAIKLLTPEDGRLARLVCADALPDEEAALIVSVENAVNRLVCIADALADGFYEDDAPATQQIGYSFMGSGFLPVRASFRSAQVLLPRMETYGGPTVSFFNEVDWRVMDAVAGNCRAVFQHSMLANPCQMVMGVRAPKDSDWDVRTRLARILERLELPLRCNFKFDCDIARNAVSVRFTAPPPSELPALMQRDDQGGYHFNSCTRNAHHVFCMRLACLVAAACFGSGRSVNTAFLTATDDTGEVMLSCEFERDSYVHNVISAIDDGRLSSPAMRANAYGIANMLNACQLRWAQRDGQKVEELDDGMSTQRIDPHLDKRALSPEMRDLFRAQRACDLVYEVADDDIPEFVMDALGDSREHIVLAIAQLEMMVADAEAAMQPPAYAPDATPLYAPSPLMRLAVHLAKDQMDVANQAEALLREAAGLHEPDAEPLCFGIQGSEFWPLHALALVHFATGNYEDASKVADRCIELAPTFHESYVLKANALWMLKQRERAANVLTHALKYATNALDSARLYFRLGQTLLSLGSKDLSAAVHVYNAALEGPDAEKSREIVASLQAKGQLPREYAAHADAARYLRRAGIPEAPVDMRPLVARATLGLACAGMPRAAAVYGNLLASLMPNSNVIVAACRSLAEGTGKLD